MIFFGVQAHWGLAVDGQGGVTQVLNLLNEELALAMTLAGCARLDDITPDLLYHDPMFHTVCFDNDRPSRAAAGDLLTTGGRVEHGRVTKR